MVIKRRQRVEVIADLLRVCSEDKLVGKTKVFYGSMLSHSLFKEYIDILVNAGCLFVVNERNGNVKYLRTVKGSELILDIECVFDKLVVVTKGVSTPVGATRTERSEGV